MADTSNFGPLTVETGCDICQQQCPMTNGWHQPLPPLTVSAIPEHGGPVHGGVPSDATILPMPS